RLRYGPLGLFRPLATLLLLVAPLGLVAAAALSDAGSGPTPGRSAAAPAPAAMSVDDWMPTLPAPATPITWAPSPGALVAWPLQGTLTQPFGCTGFNRERPAQQCPSGFHTGIDLAQAQGTPIRAAAAGLAYPI